MPIGSYAATAPLVQSLIRAHPRSVLDLGMGFGFGGVVVRQWLDLGVRPWKTYLVGVEVWSDYRNPVWDLYSAVHVQTIEQFLATSTEAFDCVLLGDVIEHFEKEAGTWLLKDLQGRVAPRGCLLVATPARFFPQGACYNNEWERHRSLWTESDFAALGFTCERTGRQDFFCGECLFAHWSQ
jgi:hypothetical protein